VVRIWRLPPRKTCTAICAMAVPSGTKASFIECRITLDGDLSGSGGLNTAASVIHNNIRRACGPSPSSVTRHS
jgi:hypothetical protein